MRAFREYLRTPPSVTKEPTGLFGIKGLNSANGLANFARQSLEKAQSLNKDLCQFEHLNPGKHAGSNEIRKLDELSNALCCAVDMAAFLRIAHPSQKMTQVSQQVHELLFGFMSELNTSRMLFKLVQSALSNPEMGGEERKVGEILQHDFLKSGIQFDDDPERQERFVDLSTSISVKGQQFLTAVNLPSESDHLEFTAAELSGVSPALLAGLGKLGSSLLKGRIHIPSSDPNVWEHILATATNPETRRKVWQHMQSAPKQQVRLLDEVLFERQELAQLAGYDTYANYELSDKLMQRASNVDEFLTSLARTMRPLTAAELVKVGNPQRPWDYAYLLSKYRSQLRRMVSPPVFELDRVFGALSDLIYRLYGLTFQPGDVTPGEVWAPEVTRIDVYDGTEKVGLIYCDLMRRQGKQLNPAHFTIQCARREFPSEKRQLPIIALVCDFEEDRGKQQIYLKYHDVQTLFHEMGHALHSMIGRTDLHNVAGTRCATDFVELPSILFEKFASDPVVLTAMKPGLDAASFLSKQNRVDLASQCREIWHQLCLSFLDQALHGKPFVQLKSGQAVANQITDNYTLFPESPLDQQHSQQFAHFGHLISYGSTYYSYLLDRCLAAMSWEMLFKDHNNWEAGGHKFKEQILKWGGAKSSNDCLEYLLGRELDYAEVASYLAK